MKKLKYLLLVSILFSCNSRDTIVDKNLLLGSDYRLFQNTRTWNLAKAVQDKNVKEIVEIVKSNKALINDSEPIFGKTLLMQSISHHQYEVAKLLLGLGANPNIHDKSAGRSAIIMACGDGDINSQIISTLLDYGANVNDIEEGKRKEGNTTRNTPLMAASRRGNLPLVTFLISKGANVNYKNEYDQTALIEAILQEKYDIVLSLLKNGADYKQIIFERPDEKTKLGILEVLREDIFPLNSKEYNFKQQIIQFMKSKGIIYSDVPIPEFIIDKVKKEYPNDWEEYLKKY